jgi:hypothetical protein
VCGDGTTHSTRDEPFDSVDLALQKAAAILQAVSPNDPEALTPATMSAQALMALDTWGASEGAGR